VVAEVHAQTAVPSDVMLASDAEGHGGSVHATTDFRVAPMPVKRPTPGPATPDRPGPHRRGATPSASPSVGPKSPLVSGTYTPVARDEHRKFEDAEEDSQVWISPSTWAIVGAILMIGLLVWYWLQPPSAEKLYAKITEASKEGDVNRLLEVEPEIISFQTYYSGDRRMTELQGYLDEIELHRLEKKFQFRARFLSKNDGLSPIERAYFEAIGYLHLEPSLGRRKLEALVTLYRGEAQATKQQRDCLLLAQKQLDRLDARNREQAAADQRVVESQLKRVEELAKTDPTTARKLLEAVEELYGGEPWVEPLLEKARLRLEEATEATAREP
jgi:eukaryotic-like serine/threonine-protein kinase